MADLKPFHVVLKQSRNLNIFMSEDMVIDHLPEQYEDSLDAFT
jgi:hypothetical protein